VPDQPARDLILEQIEINPTEEAAAGSRKTE